ncbi:hypothetical protein Sru01_48120 [Sphaerisporangium rufum]|uniref:Uncharacterized protein n=1 Tax=Sphaerisporangium rufum TaxID=1381558 RepID=A0A919V6Z4_9ACTN|nr:hypothetical protein Sru01_48120 [Sphaerisporangium rufum]
MVPRVTAPDDSRRGGAGGGEMWPARPGGLWCEDRPGSGSGFAIKFHLSQSQHSVPVPLGANAEMIAKVSICRN